MDSAVHFLKKKKEEEDEEEIKLGKGCIGREVQRKLEWLNGSKYENTLCKCIKFSKNK